MIKNNQGIHGQQALDQESKRFSDEVFYIFDTYRDWQTGHNFRNKYYPTITCVCTDSNETLLGEDHSRRLCMKEYEKTQMLEEMGRQFCPNGVVTKWQDLLVNSHYDYPAGQCAEQHAANELLLGLGNRVDIKNDILFGKPIRCVTGEENVYCQNCKELFDI